MSNANLLAALTPGESSTLEFKKSTAEKDLACRTFCAFANGEGGRVLFGVTPAGKPAGQSVSDRTLAGLKLAPAHDPVGALHATPLLLTVERVPVEAGREALANAFVHRDYATGA
jgi:ATP-dependent DNA helicase RecG